MHVLVRTVRGLEGFAADEIRERGLGTVERIGHREVLVADAVPAPSIMSLRTADDVLLVVGTVAGVGRAKADLPRLTRALSDLDVREVVRLREQCGGPGRPAGVDVSASFLGRRGYNRFDIEDTVGASLGRMLGPAGASAGCDLDEP